VVGIIGLTSILTLQDDRLLLGGGRVDSPGLYMEPTIFCDVEESNI
jgi:hypothetical protein